MVTVVEFKWMALCVTSWDGPCMQSAEPSGIEMAVSVV